MATVTKAEGSDVRSPEAQRIYDRLKQKRYTVDKICDVVGAAVLVPAGIISVVPLAGATVGGAIYHLCMNDEARADSCADKAIKVAGAPIAAASSCLSGTRKLAHRVADCC